MSETEQSEDAGEQAEKQGRGPEHLRKYQFKPGVSGNPSGRPKGRINLTQRLERRLLKELADGTMEIDGVVSALIREMKDDPAKMTTFILKLIDRDEGPVIQDVNLSAAFTMEDLAKMVGAEDGE